jgi:predicted RNA-binding protein Jag
MKSIMEEASSIIKAIEKGWVKAGQPKEFSVKILEHPQKNFLGLTVKSAKIAILFDEQPRAYELPPQDQKQRPVVRQPKEQHRKPKTRTADQQAKRVTQPLAEPAKAVTKQTYWTPEMLSTVQDWLTQALAILQVPALTFGMEPERATLKINLNGQIFADASKERAVLRAFSQLILQMLRHTFKRSMRGYKIILTSS